MTLHPVQSSRIKALGYDEDTWTCYVQFRPTRREPKGTIYAYANVPPEMFGRFSAASSKGQFFGEQLSDREEHPALRLGEPHTAPRQPGESPASILMFRPAEGPVLPTEPTGRVPKPPAGSAAQSYIASSEELMQLARERELLLEFFRPMRESTLAAYRAVVKQEEQALAQFQAAEAALAAQLGRDGRRTGGGK